MTYASPAMPQETKSTPSESMIAAAVNLPGLNMDLPTQADPVQVFEILEKAFDYRGDVTLTLANGSSVAGYLFDRRRGTTLAESNVRLLPAGSDEKVTVSYHQIRRIAFSDRDPAAGKSFETWIKKYVEKKLAGEKASIESEPLEE